MHGDIDYTTENIVKRALNAIDKIIAEPNFDQRMGLIMNLRNWLRAECVALEMTKQFSGKYPPFYGTDQKKKDKRVDSD